MANLTTSTAKRNAWIAWLDHCAGRDGAWANPTFFGKVVGGVPEPWADPLLALEMALKATGYTPRSAWAYNFRGIGGKACSCSNYGSCSLHSQGIAIDIDPKLNPFVAISNLSWSKTAFTPTQIAAVEGIKNTKGEQLWFWAGRWRTIKDYMHFETYVGPGSTAVDWGTVPEAEGDEGMILKRGDKGKMVAEIQKAMATFFKQNNGTWPPFAGVSGFDGKAFSPGQDGGFGGTCETNVKNVQKLFGMSQNGVADASFQVVIFSQYGGAASGGDHPDSDHAGLATKSALKGMSDKLSAHTADAKTSTPHS